MKLKNISGNILIVLLLLNAINSTIFFLFNLKVSVLEWLVMNACAPSIFIFVAGYFVYRIKKNSLLLISGATLMAFFGTGGLFLFGWDGYNIISQISHICMTLSVLWTIYFVIIKDWKSIKLKWIIPAITFAIIVIVAQQMYIYNNPQLLNVLFGKEMIEKQ